MAVDKYLQVTDEQGNVVDYDIRAIDVKFQDGKDLPTKLDEIEQEIEDIPGYEPPVSGIPATDLDAGVNESLQKADTAYQKPAGGIPSTDMTQAVQDALEDAGTALQPEDMATVNGQSLTQGGNISIPAGADGKSAYEIAVEEGFVGTEQEWLDSLQGPQGQQGPMGNVTLTDGDLDSLQIANVLDGTGDVVGVPAGMTIKNNINSLYTSIARLYSKLANMAFWDAQDQLDAAPDPMDWNVPPVIVTITNNLANSAITNNGTPVSGTLVVDMGDTLNLLVSPEPGFILKTVLVDGVSATDNGDGTFTITLANISSNTTIVITGTYAVAVGVSLVNTDGQLELSPLSAESGEDYNGTLAVKAGVTGYDLPSTITATMGGVAVTFDGVTNIYDPSDGSITIANVTDDIVITAVAAVGWSIAPKADEGNPVTRYGMQQGRSINASHGFVTGGMINNNEVPSVILSPAGYPYDTKTFSSDKPDGVHANTNPGKSENCYFATGGARYLNVKMEFNASEQTSGFDYKVAVGCYTSAVIGNNNNDIFSGDSDITGKVGRINYRKGNTTEDAYSVATGDTFVWKFNLYEFATDNSQQEGAITQIKLLVCKYTSGTSNGIGSATWIDNMTLKYKFTDD